MTYDDLPPRFELKCAGCELPLFVFTKLKHEKGHTQIVNTFAFHTTKAAVKEQMAFAVCNACGAKTAFDLALALTLGEPPLL
jgi:hypothetical protein